MNLFSNFLDLSGVANQVESLLDSEVVLYSVSRNGSLDLVNVHLVLLSHISVFLLEILVSYSDVLQLSDLLESEAQVNLALSNLCEVSSELIHCSAGVLEVILDADTVSCAPLTNDVVDTALVHNLRNLSSHLCDNSVNQCVVEVCGSLVSSSLLQLGLDVSLVLVEGIELADVLNELVVNLRQLLALQFVQLALEYSRLASEVLSLIVLRECNVYVELVADVLANNLILKSGDKGTGTELQRELLTLAALESNAIKEALEVDYSGIAVLCSSVLNGNASCVSVANLFDLCVNSSVIYILGCFLNF